MGEAGRIAIITEGRTREPQYFSSLKSLFFPSSELDVICLPSEGTIYALWKKLKEDEFQTDLIEVVRERSADAAANLGDRKRDDFQEIYLFYDFDPQQSDLSGARDPDMASVLRSMMETFDNETELGKLYISYPMVEALWDIKEWNCEPQDRWRVPVQDLKEHLYKRYSSQKNPCINENNTHTDVTTYTQETWNMILSIFLVRCGCLFGSTLTPDQLYAWYKKEISPDAILEKELEVLQKDEEIFVLSAFPVRLLDYFRSERWPSLLEDLKRVSQPICKPGVITDT